VNCPLNAFTRCGCLLYFLPAGAEVSVAGFKAKDGSAAATATEITLRDGRKLVRGYLSRR
jgi:hypothetical protein